MRIGIYNPQVGVVQSGGTETFLREIMRNISTEHEILLYTGEGDDEFRPNAENVSVRRTPYLQRSSTVNREISLRLGIPPFLLESLTFFLNAKRDGLLAQLTDKVDVVSTHYFLDNILLSQAVARPIMFHFPGISDFDIEFRVMRHLGDADMHLANSKGTKRRAEQLGFDVDGVVQPGVDVRRFSPTADPAFSDANPVILYVGRLDRGKGVNDLIDAHARLDRLASLYLVGDGELETELRKRVRVHGTEDRVTFLGPVNHEEIHRFYAACDVFCLPSYQEGFGIVNVEAAACGKPVVSTRLEGITEYLEHGEHGFLFEPGDVSGLTSSLERLIEDRKLRRQLGENAREMAQSYSWQNQAERMEYFYEKLANRHRALDEST